MSKKQKPNTGTQSEINGNQNTIELYATRSGTSKVNRRLLENTIWENIEQKLDEKFNFITNQNELLLRIEDVYDIKSDEINAKYFDEYLKNPIISLNKYRNEINEYSKEYYAKYEYDNSLIEKISSSLQGMLNKLNEIKSLRQLNEEFGSPSCVLFKLNFIQISMILYLEAIEIELKSKALFHLLNWDDIENYLKNIENNFKRREYLTSLEINLLEFKTRFDDKYVNIHSIASDKANEPYKVFLYRILNSNTWENEYLKKSMCHFIEKDYFEKIHNLITNKLDAEAKQTALHIKNSQYGCYFDGEILHWGQSLTKLAKTFYLLYKDEIDDIGDIKPLVLDKLQDKKIIKLKGYDFSFQALRNQFPDKVAKNGRKTNESYKEKSKILKTGPKKYEADAQNYFNGVLLSFLRRYDMGPSRTVPESVHQ